MSKHIDDIELELQQPSPRRVAPDVHGFQEGRSGIWCGLLYVALVSAVILLAHSFLGMPGDAEGAELIAAEAVKQELTALKEHGVVVQGNARTTAAEIFNEQYQVHQIEVTTHYSYPGGSGVVTSKEVSPKTTNVYRHDGERASGDLVRRLNSPEPQAIDVVRLPDRPAVHRLTSQLDRELSDATKKVEELRERTEEASRQYGAIWWGAVLLASPGWYMLLAGLCQVIYWRHDQSFRSPSARRLRDLASNGVAVRATITHLERTDHLPVFRPRMTAAEALQPEGECIAHHRFEGPDGTLRTGTFALCALFEANEFPVGSHVTVLYDPANPDDFVLYRDLKGVKVLPPSQAESTVS